MIQNKDTSFRDRYWDVKNQPGREISFPVISNDIKFIHVFGGICKVMIS